MEMRLRLAEPESELSTALAIFHFSDLVEVSQTFTLFIRCARLGFSFWSGRFVRSRRSLLISVFRFFPLFIVRIPLSCCEGHIMIACFQGYSSDNFISWYPEMLFSFRFIFSSPRFRNEFRGVESSRSSFSLWENGIEFLRKFYDSWKTILILIWPQRNQQIWSTIQIWIVANSLNRNDMSELETSSWIFF